LYQTQKWERPANLVLEKLAETGDTIRVHVRALDANSLLCLDARNVVRFDVTGDGRLLDNLGTSTAARKVELYNGRALISLQKKGEVVVSVSSEGLPTTFLTLA